MAKFCPVCGTENLDQAETCVKCGADLTAEGGAIATATAPVEQIIAPVEQPAATAEPTVTPAEQPVAPAEPPAELVAPLPMMARLDEAAEAAEFAPEPLPVAEPASPAEVAASALELSTAPLFTAPEPLPPGLTAVTAPTLLLPFSDELLQPLPAGAILDGRYRIKAIVERNAGRNLYRASARNQQRCPNCGAVQPPGTGQCRRCGHELTGEAAVNDYFVAESFSREQLVRDPELFEKSLTHPHLMALVDLFSYTPYGPPRYYSVAEGWRGVPLAQLGLPQPSAQVLDWGTQISAALAYLHQRGVVSSGATPENILIREQEAVLTNLQDAHPAPAEPEQRDREVAGDIARLAATLYETMTGKFATVAGSGPMLDDTHPPEVEQLFERALRPAKDAAPLTDAEWGALLIAARQSLESTGPGVRIRSGRVSNVGRVRELNEDSVAVVECQVMQDAATASLGVYVVADGMGGHQSGEVASAIAISAVTESLVKQFVAPQFNLDAEPPDADQIKKWLGGAVQVANARIHQQRASYRNDMGTTVVAALVAGQRIYVANVGDSRAYIMLPGANGNAANFHQLTVDHSLVQRLISTGQITEDEAKIHPYRNVIYNSLGEKAQVQLDIFTERARPGTRLMLCSDGLSNMISDKRMAEILTTYDDPQAACVELVKEANQNGGLDNISAILVYVEQA